MIDPSQEREFKIIFHLKVTLSWQSQKVDFMHVQHSK